MDMVIFQDLPANLSIILNLFVPDSEFDKKMMWMISRYVLFIWDKIFVRNAEVKLEQFFGFLTFLT